jgi:hypothetical protein
MKIRVFALSHVALVEFLTWAEEHPHATLTEIEERVGKLREDLLASAIEGVIATRGHTR